MCACGSDGCHRALVHFNIVAHDRQSEPGSLHAGCRGIFAASQGKPFCLAQHAQKYSIAFVLFAGEEIGLLGSKYYTENSIIPLKKIRFLTNTDLAGTGIDGITVVNATEFPKEFALMQKINTEGKYLKAVNARGKAANSDHYFFTEKGVPSFFFYTLGGIAAYHDVFDKAATLPLNEQADLFQLLVKFNEALQK